MALAFEDVEHFPGWLRTLSMRKLRRTNERALRWVCAAAIVGLVLPSTVVSAQTTGAPLAFAAASIRRNVENKGTCDPIQVQPTLNGTHMTNCPLLVVIGAAYVPTSGNPLGYLVEDRIAGEPGWVTQERYDVEARIAEADA